MIQQAKKASPIADLIDFECRRDKEQASNAEVLKTTEDAGADALNLMGFVNEHHAKTRSQTRVDLKPGVLPANLLTVNIVHISREFVLSIVICITIGVLMACLVDTALKGFLQGDALGSQLLPVTMAFGGHGDRSAHQSCMSGEDNHTERLNGFRGATLVEEPDEVFVGLADDTDLFLVWSACDGGTGKVVETETSAIAEKLMPGIILRTELASGDMKTGGGSEYPS
jgi:hypothetical protein